MVEDGEKLAQVRTTATYTIKEHFTGKPKAIQELMYNISEYVMGLDPRIEEVPKKYYIAYKGSQNIVCVEAKNRHIKLCVKLKPSDVFDPPSYYRDVSNIGHLGTGNAEFTISTQEELEEVKRFIELAYNKVGG